MPNKAFPMDTQMTTLWLSCPSPNPAASQRLICFPYAGGNASTYFQWHLWLHPDIELWIVQMPGRTNRFHETPIRDMEFLVECLRRAVRPLLDKPFSFFGHSLGSRVAFALLDKLATEQSRLPSHFFASASAAPHLTRQRTPTINFTDAEFLQMLQQLGGTPPLLLQHAELMELALPMLRADFNLAETYRYLKQQRFPVNITIFCGQDDQDVCLKDAMAWRVLFTGEDSLHLIHGNHFYVDKTPKPVIQVINEVMSSSPHPQHSEQGQTEIAI